jgi:hypothetical protein
VAGDPMRLPKARTASAIIQVAHAIVENHLGRFAARRFVSVEAFVLERPQVPGADPRLALHLSQLELPTHPHLAKAAADLEHLVSV